MDTVVFPPPGEYPTGPVVYLIHFDRPLKHAKHYIGSTQNMPERMRCHEAGNADSAALLRALKKEGIGWRVVGVGGFDTIEEAREWEYSFKKNGRGSHSRKASRDCPVCRLEAMKRNAECVRRCRARKKAATLPKIPTCADCGVEMPERHPATKLCFDCSEERQRNRVRDRKKKQTGI